jgi:cell division ATPase FtsA
MNFLRRFQRKKQQRPTAYSLIDVGRDTVKAVVVLLISGNVEPQVVGYGQAETGNRDITGGRIEAGAVTRPVNVALTQAEDSAEAFIGRKIVPDDVIFALAGRATIGKLFTVRQTRPKPKDPISVKELNNLRARAERLVRQGLSEAYFEGGQWQPLAVTDAGMYLDGYAVLDGLGLTGREISFSVFGVAGQASALRALEILANRLDLRLANVVASPQALASIAPQAEAIILDIGFSGTDICLIKGDVLVAADWMPLGGYFFTQALARSMEIDLTTARVLKHTYADGDLSKAETAQVELHLAGLRRRWYQAVMEVLAQLSPDESLPRQIYMAGNGSLLPGLDKALRTNPGLFDSAPEVSRLGKQAWFIKDLTGSLDYNLFALAVSLTVGISG